MAKGQSLQDPFLNALRRERVPVSIYLVNGIKLQGTVESFDQFVVLLRNTVSQMVYKHAISTVVPTRNVRVGPETGPGRCRHPIRQKPTSNSSCSNDPEKANARCCCSRRRPADNDPGARDEFGELARSAGATVVGTSPRASSARIRAISSAPARPKSSSGTRQALDADLILVNHALSPVQERNLETPHRMPRRRPHRV